MIDFKDMEDGKETISIQGARVHNLKNMDVEIPRDSLTVITGLSGSGKSSLAFDTIFAEGQRRYIETFSAYARSFLGGMERPDVDKITGLSPVISIEQKTTNKNPRSTVGTTTEIYDYLRLLFARAGTAYSYISGEKMVKYTEEQILNTEKGLNPYVYPNADWYDLIFKEGNYNQRANINLQGGGSRVTYYMSLQANHDTGLLDAPKNYYYDTNINNWEYNFQNNISYKVTNTTTIDLRMMAQIGNRQGPNYSVSDMYQTVMRANPVAFPAYFPSQEGDDGFIRFGNAEIKPNVLGKNPYAEMLGSFKETNYNTLNTSISLNQKLDFITEGLSLKALVNFKNWSESSYNRSIKPYYYKVKDGSYLPDTDEYELQLLQTGDQYLSHVWTGSVVLATITCQPC